MESQYFYINQTSIQKEINAKYQIASKELQNLYKRSIMIEPLLQILEDIYSKEDEGAAIAPLSLSINQIKNLNADIKTCLLNVKEKKSGPFQRIIKTKGENIDDLENKMDKLVKDLEVALVNAEQAAKANSEKKRKQKEMAKNNANNNIQNNYNEQAQPVKYSLNDSYPQEYYNSTEVYNNNYSYNNAAANYNSNNYQESANYNYVDTNNNINTNQNYNNTDLDANLSNQFSYLNVTEENNTENTENKIENNTNTIYDVSNSNNNVQYNYNNGTDTNQPSQINVQPPNYQETQGNYCPQDNNNQFYNTYSNPNQQYYYGTLTKNDNQQSQQMNNYNQQQQMNNYGQQQMGNYDQQQNENNYNPNNSYQGINDYNNQYQQQNQQMVYDDNNQIQLQQIQTQISASDATTMEGDSLINQKGLIPPTQYFAISSFTPRQPDELAIEQGDEVIIVQTFDDGWAFGRNSRTRMVGVLPMTFLSCNNQYNNYQYNNKLPDRQSSRRV
jgi:hypothetical protein